MTVLRIVPVIAGNPSEAEAFYRDVLGLEVVMDHGWITTYAAPTTGSPQVSVAREGGAGQQVPDLSVEVDDLDETHARALAAGFAVEYGPATEAWGVRRFFVRDPFGRLVNVVAHLR